MKFLADMPISPKTVSFLRSMMYDVYRNSEIGLLRARDVEIVDIAVREERIILTMDLDFAAIIAKSKGTTPSAIIFRVSDETPENVNRLLYTILPQVEEDVVKGAIIMVDDGRFRIRRLPV